MTNKMPLEGLIILKRLTTSKQFSEHLRRYQGEKSSCGQSGDRTMTEPLTDEEFEKRRDKVVFETSYPGLVTQEDYDYLIATVESLKKEVERRGEMVHKEAQARIKEQIEYCELVEENAKLRAEGRYWKHTAAIWLPGKYGKILKLEGWGKNYKGLGDTNELRLK